MTSNNDKNKRTLYRPNVGIILKNNNDLIFLGKRSDIDDHSSPWQMPQGGIDENEDPISAATRELYEETGVTKDNIEFIAKSNNWYSYDYPDSAFINNEHIKNSPYRGQKQIWVMFKLKQIPPTAINLNNAQHNEFSSYQWAPPAKVVELAVDFRKDIYQKVMNEFTSRGFL